MSYAIGSYGFIRWNGPPPRLVTEHVRTFNKPGQPGTSAQLLGIYGDMFEVELDAAFANQTLASVAEEGYRDLIGTTAAVVYNDVNYFTDYDHSYLIVAMMVTHIKAMPRMIGYGYNYSPGWMVRSRWQMVPIV